MQKEIKEKIGKYLLLEKLTEEGFIKEYRAANTESDPEEMVTVKMLDPRFAGSDEFIHIFLDEIKLTMGLQHPNIVKLLEIDEHKGQTFLVLEYFAGMTATELISTSQKKEEPLPVALALSIIKQVSRALYYTHTYIDVQSGRCLNIIHRNITPQNIKLGLEGEVKLKGFDIAKADSNSEETQSGIIKGKFSYLAPEYIESSQLTPKSDQFSTGVVLWELLTGRNLFYSESDVEVLQKIQKCQVEAPSKYKNDIPKELDDLVLKSLSKNPDDRWQDMDQFANQIDSLLTSEFRSFVESDFVSFVRKMADQITVP